MPESETLQIIIKLRDQANKELEQLNQSLKKIDRTAEKTNKGLSRFTAGIRKVRSSVLNMRTAALGAATAIGALFLGRKLIDASNAQAEAVEGLNQALVAMGRYTPELSAQLQGVASSLQQVTNFGDEAVIEGQKFLATYSDITDELLPRSTKVMADLATLMGGDTVQAANLLGKASLGMTGALRRVGITVDSNTFKMEGYAGLLDAIESQVGGQAEAQRRATGSLTALGNSFGDLQEKAGDFVKLAIEPTVRAIVEIFDDWNNKLQELKDEGALVEYAKEASLWILRLTEIVIKGAALIGDAFNGWKLIWNGLKAAFALFAEGLNRGLAGIIGIVVKVRESIGELLQDTARLTERFDFIPGVKGLQELADGYDETTNRLKETNQLLDRNADYWYGVAAASSDAIVEIAKQPTYYSRASKFLDQLRTKVTAYTSELKQATDRVVDLVPATEDEDPTASLDARLKSALGRAQAIIETELANVDAAYEANLSSLEEYYNQRQALAEESFNNELQYLQALAEQEKDPDKLLAINDQIFALEQKHTQDMLQLRIDRQAAEDALDQGRLQIIQEQAAQELELAQARGANLAEIFEMENAQLAQQHADRIAALVEAKATEAMIEDQHRLNQLESDQQLADQRKQVITQTLQSTVDTFSNMQSAFSDIMEVMGDESKEFALAQKAIAIFLAGIKTYESAVAAYASASQIPVIGWIMGPIAAAAAIAAGLARIAAIRNQSLAEGGRVKGYSPNPKADNIPINATAGEFMQPVQTVKHYGLSAMEAIRRRMVPKEALTGFRFPNVPKPRYGMQTGGLATSGGAGTGPKPPTTPQGGEGGGEQNVNINNIIDPQMMDQYVTSKPGQRNIMNVMSQNDFALKQIVLGE